MKESVFSGFLTLLKRIFGAFGGHTSPPNPTEPRHSLSPYFFPFETGQAEKMFVETYAPSP
jgi:hypothetical protein